MEGSKQERMLEIFFRGLRGEDISIQKLAVQYGVSTKSISRTINDIKAFLADHRELVGNTELQYSHRDKCYRLRMDEFLTNQELFALIEVVIGARAFSKEERTYPQGAVPLHGGQTRLRKRAGYALAARALHYGKAGNYRRILPFRSGPYSASPASGVGHVYGFLFLPHCLRYRRRYGKAPVFPRRPHQALYDGRRAGL